MTQPTYFEYQTLEVKDSLFRGKQSAAAISGLLNEQARMGWRFKHMMSDDIKGRLGIGSTSGVLLVFERPVATATPPPPRL